MDVILANISKQGFKQHVTRKDMQRFACEKRIGEKDCGIYAKLKRKARGELSAFRIDGKKQGNRFGIDLGPNAVATVAAKMIFVQQMDTAKV
ncbi:hypothetical protein CEXT_267461 [Caerostris extrusa]|uniref:Uncharacterized protein n=1 Tax=Caerostris extrusa TaxID=172846 RepID=A0AAV4QM96_CAEEX|nr:hypothetical protein CEXT_267461 [Caerostris extrusa]